MTCRRSRTQAHVNYPGVDVKKKILRYSERELKWRRGYIYVYIYMLRICIICNVYNRRSIVSSFESGLTFLVRIFSVVRDDKYWRKKIIADMLQHVCRVIVLNWTDWSRRTNWQTNAFHLARQKTLGYDFLFVLLNYHLESTKSHLFNRIIVNFFFIYHYKYLFINLS